MPKKDTAKAADVALAEAIDETGQDPAIAHHLATLQAEAKATGKPQKKVLAAWEIDGKAGERALTVQADGSHKITES